MDEMRGSGGGGGAFVTCCWPSPGCCGVSPCTFLGGAVLLDESSVSRRPDDLVGGDGHSVELTEARN